jgi:hypothetical protein
MIKIDENYTDYRDDTDGNYTCGKAIDAEDDESYEATPLKAALVNDIVGSFRAVYKKAFGNLDISNVPDNENVSDFLAALIKMVLDSPAFINNPTAPTQSQTDNSMKLATTQFVKSAITALIDSSPAALDTLKELADALGDDPNFATTMTNALAGKAPKSTALSDETESSTLPAITDTELTELLQMIRNFLKYVNNKKAPLASPALTGTPTAPTAAAGTNTGQIATAEFVYNAGYYVGKMLVQYPDEPTPVEAGLAGVWEDWSDRAVLYGVSQTPPPSFVDYYTKVGTSIASGAVPVVCYPKVGSDYQLYRFIAQPDA